MTSEIKILSWNIWGGQYLPEIIAFLKEARADIIGLQEVIENMDGTGNVAKIIAEELGYEYFFVPTYEVETSRLYHKLESKTVKMGNAILSKHKLIGTKTHELSEEKKRLALEVSISVGNTTISVLSTHLKHTHQEPSELQDLQAKSLLAYMPKENAIVTGDFNATPGSNCIKMMEETLQNTDKELLPTWSVYPEGCPVCNPQHLDTRLDYIFTTKDMKTHSPTVHASKGSDHLPISVMVEVFG